MRVVLVTGIHRSARGLSVDELLATSPGSVSVHHDLEEIGEGIVHRVVRDATGRVEREHVDLVHACASCTLREDLIPYLLRMAAEDPPGLCVVEAWDGVEPKLIAEAIAHEGALRLVAVVGAVDSGRLVEDLLSDDDLGDRGLDIAEDDNRTVSEVLTRQIEYPSVIDLYGTDAGSEAHVLVEHLNPAAVVALPGSRAIDPTRGLFDPGAAHARSNPAWAQYGDRLDGRVRTFTWTRTRPLHPQRFADALEQVLSTSVRGRGRFWLASQADSLLVWESFGALLLVEDGGPWMDALPPAAMDVAPEARRVSALLDWDPEAGDRRQHLSFVGVGLDTAALESLLDSCLVTDEETGQEFSTDPFAEFSER
ncbi:GTP-binding protein [Nocardiopsis tropica]|nr:GTP-binding protein [Nocardiopsis tropica]